MMFDIGIDAHTQGHISPLGKKHMCIILKTKRQSFADAQVQLRYKY